MEPVLHRYVQEAIAMVQQCLTEDDIRNRVVSPVCRMILKEIHPYSTYVVAVGFGILVVCVVQLVISLIVMYNVSTLHKVVLVR